MSFLLVRVILCLNLFRLRFVSVGFWLFCILSNLLRVITSSEFDDDYTNSRENESKLDEADEMAMVASMTSKRR
jgi:hypothetical protein